MPKRGPDDILRDIEDSEAEEAADRALAMSPDERQKALRDAGFDLDALHARADEWHARMQRAPIDEARRRLEADAARKSLRPAPSPRRRFAVLVAAALVAIAVVIALVILPRPVSKEMPVARPSATAPPSATMGVGQPSATAPSSIPSSPSPSVPPSASARDAAPAPPRKKPRQESPASPPK